MPAFGQTAFGQNRIWPKKSEFGQFVFVTAFGQPAFGQFGCFNVLAKISVVVVVVVPGCCCCSWLLPVGACWCLVPVGACWCLLVVPVGGCCLCVWVGVFKIFGPLPRTPLRRTALPLDRPKSCFEVFPVDHHQTGPPGLHTTTRELQTRTFERPGASNTTKIPRENPQREKKE